MSKPKRKGIMSSVCVILAAVVVVCGVCGLIYGVLLKPADFEHVVPASGEGTGYYRHSYESLNDDEKFVYSVILGEIYTQPDKIEIPDLENCNLSKIYEAISLDNPDLMGLSYNCKSYKMGNKTYFIPDYEMSLAEYQEKLRQTEAAVETIVNNASALSSDYEKEKYVHDYIINGCTYSTPEVGHEVNTAYGCLVLGKASCEGYSRAFQLIMNRLGIDNRLVTGESETADGTYVGHMWNYVVIENSGYFIDLTWDDPEGDSEVLRHTYFNFTTSELFKSYRNVAQNLPLCSEITYNYFVREGAYFNMGSGETFKSLVSACVKDAMDRGYDCVELKFSDGIVVEQAKNTLFNEGAIYSIFKSRGIIENVEGAQVYYSADENMNTICIFF